MPSHEIQVFNAPFSEQLGTGPEVPEAHFAALSDTLAVLPVRSSGYGFHFQLASTIEQAAGINPREPVPDSERYHKLYTLVDNNLKALAEEAPERAAYIAVGLATASYGKSTTQSFVFPFLTELMLSGPESQKIVNTAWRNAAATEDIKKHQTVTSAFENFTEYLTADDVYYIPPAEQPAPTDDIHEIILRGSTEQEPEQAQRIREALGALGIQSEVRYECVADATEILPRQLMVSREELTTFAVTHGEMESSSQEAWTALAQSDVVTRVARNRMRSRGQGLSPQDKSRLTRLSERPTIFTHSQKLSRRDSDAALTPILTPHIDTVNLWNFLSDVLHDEDFNYAEVNDLGGNVQIGRHALKLLAQLTNTTLRTTHEDRLPLA